MNSKQFGRLKYELNLKYIFSFQKPVKKSIFDCKNINIKLVMILQIYNLQSVRRTAKFLKERKSS